MKLRNIKSFFQLEQADSFSFALALYIICCSMALNHGDTTLGNSMIHVIFVALKNLFLLYAAAMFLKAPKNISFSGILLLLAIVFLDALSGFSNPIFNYVGLIVFLFSTPDVKWNCYNVFYSYMIATGFIGILCYISFVFGLPLPYKIVDYYSSDMALAYGLFYADYSLCHLAVGFDGIRLCGLFNEPGYYGTIAAMYLISKGCNFRDKKDIVVLIAGILTISMAFFVLLGCYVVISNFSKIKRLLSIVFVSSVLLLVFIKVGVIPESSVDTFMDRFIYSDGSFIGDNRSNDHLDSEFEKLFTDTDHFAWGHGSLEKFDFKGVASFKQFMLRYGVIGSFIALTLLLLAALKTTKMTFKKLLFIVLFFVSIYQRPYAFEIVYILVLLGGIYNIEKVESNSLITE